VVSLATRLRRGSAPRCPYCHDHLESEGLELITCEACETQHHRECIRELGRCATYGCSESIPAPLGPVNTSVRDEIRERIRGAAGRYAEGAAAMAERPRSTVGGEKRHGDFRFLFADRMANNPEGALACLILTPLLALGLLATILSLFYP
jgi:RING finger family protein